MIASEALRPPPHTQALSSTTFRVPALDGSLTLPEIYEWHAEHSPRHRLFTYAKGDASIRDIYWPEAAKAVLVGAKILADRMPWKQGSTEPPVVAILAHSDTIPYFIMIVSILRANCVAFPISPRNSPAAVAHLINRVGVKHILVGQEPAMRDLSAAALDILRTQHPSTPEPGLSAMPLFEEIFLSNSEQALTSEDVPYVNLGPDTTVVIMHSSGSTAFPKPISWSNRRFAEAMLIPWFGERDLTNIVLSLHTMPMYHGMGVLQIFWSSSCGLVISAFEPQTPIPVPTPDTLFTAAKATNSDVILCVPSVIEAWTRKPDYVKWLATRTGVLYGGGPLNKEAGDYMTSQGVSIFVLYGCTEGGIMSTILPREVGYDWDYFRIPGNVKPHMIPCGNNTFEFVMVSNHFNTPTVLNMKVDGVDAYATSDLLVPHPTKPDYWKIFGRTDDQIMHNTGEKTNPGPLESMLNQDPHVLSSVMFGRGRFQAGILVDPKPEFRFDPSDQVKLADFRNKIWPTVERMNEFAPQHSRLFKEMIIVSKPSKPFTYTAKSTARRQAVINDYEEEINALYDVVEESTQSNIPPPSHWDMLSTTDFVRAVVSQVLVHKVTDDDDLFEHGCDSLQATWIRNALLRALKDSAHLDTRKTSGNFVYDYPSIRHLASFVSTLACGEDSEADDSGNAHIDAMRAMVAKYSKNFPSHKTSARGDSLAPNGDVVLVTGTTGSLGCHILVKLAANTEVSRVYALNRVSRDGSSLQERQNKALVERGLNAGILDNDKIMLLEGDLNVENSGLSERIYNEVHESVTHIIHNAWRVDFNLALTSFDSNVKGLRNLIDFALTSPRSQPPHLSFTSSIGVFQNVHSDEVQAEAPLEPEVVVGTGYVESKWVSEELLFKAMNETSLTALAVRVGQICGGLDGAWNIQEWFPSMVQGGEKLGLFPSDDRVVAWIPPEMTADALIDFRKAARTTKVVHLVHPRPVSWNTIANAISSHLSVPLVPYADWLAKLEGTVNTKGQTTTQANNHTEVELLRDIRALRLLPFFRSLAPKLTGGEAMGFPALAVTKGMSASPTLADPFIPQLSADDVRRWIIYWRKAGLLSQI